MHARTGHVAEAFHVGPKILWLTDHRPAVFAGRSRVLQPRDLVACALTVEIRDGRDARGRDVRAYDLRRRAWADDLVNGIGLVTRLLPPRAAPVRADRRARGQASAAARRAGPPAARSSGAEPTPRPAPSARGTSRAGERNGGVVLLPERDGAGRRSLELRVTHYSHVLPDRFCAELGVDATGAAVGWGVSRLGFNDFASFETAANRRSTARSETAAVRDESDDRRSAVPRRISADGERNDVHLRAGFIRSLADRHTRDDLAYAVLEGVAFAVAERRGLGRSRVGRFSELRVAGGGSRLLTAGSGIKADVLGATVRHLRADSTAVGGWRCSPPAPPAARRRGGRGHRRARRRGRPFRPRPGGAHDSLSRRRAWFHAVRGCRSGAGWGGRREARHQHLLRGQALAAARGVGRRRRRRARARPRPAQPRPRRPVHALFGELAEEARANPARTWRPERPQPGLDLHGSRRRIRRTS